MRLGTRAVRFSETVKLSCWLVDSRRDLDFVRLEWDTSPWQESHRQGPVSGRSSVWVPERAHSGACAADHGQDFASPAILVEVALGGN